jgi:hypothetical protein
LGDRSRRACLGTRALPRTFDSRMARLAPGRVAGGSVAGARRARGWWFRSRPPLASWDSSCSSQPAPRSRWIGKCSIC